MTLRFLLPVTLLLAAACHSRSEPMSIETAPFDTKLQVDLKASTRTASGLYFRDITLGEGKVAEAGDRVEVFYAGSLPNGRQFDARRVGQEPFAFQLGAGRVIRGWDEGVQGMRVGGTRQLIIPPSLGYGAQGVGPIPPNVILVFTVELVGVGR